jgi:hypothetical protein
MSQQVLGAGRNEALAQQHIIIITILSQQQCYHNNSPKGSLEACTVYGVQYLRPGSAQIRSQNFDLVPGFLYFAPLLIL